MQDKRKSPRKASLTRCTVDCLFLKDNNLDSRVVNYSDDGLMLELDHPLKPGDAIKIHFSTDTQECIEYGKDCCIGMVRWCAPQNGSYSAIYGVGVELAKGVSGVLG